MSDTNRSKINIGNLIINVLLSLFFIFPIYWSFITSVKTKTEIYKQPITLFPNNFTLANYTKMFSINNGVFVKYFFNSIFIVILTVICVVTVSVLAGYGFSKLNIKCKNIFLFLILAAIMIPFQALLNPIYSIMSTLGLLGTPLALVLAYTTFQTPFAIYMMKNAFDMVPTSLRESGLIDGASELRNFLTIMLPLTWPSVATVAIYCTYTTWNDYLVALVFANSDASKTFNVGIVSLAIGQTGTDWGLLTSGSIVSLIPIMILFIFLQKYFVSGMMSGAVK